MAMDMGKFVEPKIGSSLVSYRRAFSNWVVERQRLIDSHKTFRLHRLAAKRVVFEVEGSETYARKSRYIARVLVAIAFLLTIGGISSVIFANNKPAASPNTNPGSKLNASAALIACSKLSLVGLTPSSIESFDESGWHVSTSEMQVELGELDGFTFEATCSQQRLHGRLIASETENSWQIKRMVLVD